MLKISKLIRWIIWTGLIFLVLFTIMRLGLFILSDQQSYGLSKLGGSFFLGLRYDLQYDLLVIDRYAHFRQYSGLTSFYG